MKHLMSLFWIALYLGAPPAQAERPITIFAAASLQGVLEDVAQAQSRTLAHSYGGSGTIARQIAAGAPADLVILANPVWMNWLEQQGALTEFMPVNVTANQLALIAPSGAELVTAPDGIIARLAGERLAMGQPASVPAGTYAKQWLEATGVWPDLKDHIAETDNVRAALAFVARGETPLGVVYVTDALAEPAVDVVYAVPPETHDPILYPAVALSQAGADYLAFLQTPEAQQIFGDHGFESVPE